MEGAQHNTYDIEFYGPNPLCESWYLAELKACVEMATAMNDSDFASQCKTLFEHGADGLTQIYSIPDITFNKSEVFQKMKLPVVSA